MNKTKIDWADSTWNPVTGCLNGCEYCYARKIAERFDGKADKTPYMQLKDEPDIFYLHDALPGNDGRKMPYPFGFEPTFHHYRLNEYKSEKARTIFVCSMADLFGDWVPDRWIQEVFKACEDAPQHRYLFLTKNPKRYDALAAIGKLPIKHWYGHTVTTESNMAHGPLFNPEGFNNFLSIEPLLGNAVKGNWVHLYKWVIIGAETGNHKGKIVPKKEWVDSIVDKCPPPKVPVFMKSSLQSLMGDDFIQEYPWEVDA
jgi:protein gp37